MKKVLLLTLVVLSIFLGYSFEFGRRDNQIADIAKPKKAMLRVGLVADSHNENDLLEKALRQAQGMGVNFVVGLGDYTNLGTLEELNKAKNKLEESKLEYFLTAGDRDGWESRELGNVKNFESVFGKSTQVVDRESIRFVILDNSNIYSGIDAESWKLLNDTLSNNDGLSGQISENSKFEIRNSKLTFVLAHKTPFHPESKHIMGENSSQVAEQANQIVKVLEEERVDGFFSGDLHFFAEYKSPSGSVKMTTVGAVSAERNFQGPRFAVLTVWDDYTWDVEDVEIR